MTFHATTAASRKTQNQNHNNHERDSLLSNHETTTAAQENNNDDNKNDLQDMLLGTTSTGSSSSDPNETLLLRIKSSKDVQIYAHPSDRIAKVKSAVLHALQHKPHDNTNSTSDTTTPYVRLIAAGRLLAPDSAAVQDFDLQSGQVVHAVIAHKRGAQAAAASMPARLLTSTRALRGTGINAAGFAVRRNSNEEQEDDDDMDDDEDDSDSEEEEDIDLEQGAAAAGDVEQGTARHRHPRLQQRRERLGFDRLRDTAGLRRSEVATIRAYFSRYVDQWIRQHPVQAEQAAAGEADLVRRRLLQEDAWMQAQGPASEFRLNLGANAAGVTGTGAGAAGAGGPNNLTLPAGLTEAQRQEVLLWRSGGGISATVGTDRDFAWGFLLGFFVGFLMLLWVWMPTVPHKQKLGILTGISVQLFLSLWQDPDGNGNASLTDDLVLTGDY